MNAVKPYADDDVTGIVKAVSVELKDGRYYFLRSYCEIVMFKNHNKITFVNV